jgi:type I phosphodiesterase/nucleotide pyrophosphatase
MKSIPKSIFCILLAAAAASAAAPKPKLVLALAVDQFRYDYLTRFRADYKGGLARLLTAGAVFTNARYEHFPTVTAIGHSTFLSGATPSISGIIGNDWYQRDENRNVTSVADDSVKLLGAKGGAGSSPHRLLVSTVGDELKMAAQGKPRVIGISLKDRSAILPVGHMADGAFWFDGKTGNFVSSTYYFADLPGWVKDFNAGRPADRYKGAHFGRKTMPAEPGEKLYEALPASPFGNELIESLAERAIQAEQLGRHDVTDLLSVSFSSNDYVGHALGPDAPEVREVSIATDQMLDKLFQLLDSTVGMRNVLVVMTADHGVAPVPEVNTARKMPGGRMPARIVQDTVQVALSKKYGEGKWIVSPSEHSLYLNLDLMHAKNLDPAEVDRVAAQAALTIPHVFRTYTRERLMNGAAMEDQVGRRVMNGFYVRRSADIEIMLEPYWMFAATGTTHGTTFSYDAHVPVIFMGQGIKAGRYYANIAVNDIAPTLATMLDVETPSGSTGRVLSEIFVEANVGRVP